MRAPLKKNTKPANTTSPAKKPGKIILALLAGSIALVTLLCFLPAQDNSYISWDDGTYIYENSQLSRPLPEAFRFFFQKHLVLGSYTPLTMSALAIEYHLNGGDSPHLFHLGNILLHLLNVIL